MSARPGGTDRHSARGRRRRRLVPRIALATAAAAAVLVAVAVLPSSGGDHGGGGISSAYGAEAIRFAENAPLILLTADRWRVEYAGEQSAQEGELHVRTGPTPAPGPQDFIEGVTRTPVPKGPLGSEP